MKACPTRFRHPACSLRSAFLFLALLAASAWAPDKTVAQTARAVLPEETPAGKYRLALGLFTDKASESPAIALAVEGATPDRWHPLAAVTVAP